MKWSVECALRMPGWRWEPGAVVSGALPASKAPGAVAAAQEGHPTDGLSMHQFSDIKILGTRGSPGEKET